MARYKHPAMKQLADQQVRYAPVEVCRELMDRAEKFLAELRADQTLLYADMSEQLTGYRSDRFPDLKMPGTDAVHDVRCFIEELSGSLNLTADMMGEPVLTVQEISKRYNVSTKTVDRWRNRGLAGRLFHHENRQRIGFLQSSVERFVKTHSVEVARGTRFSQLSEVDREQIIRRARRMAAVGGNLSEISRRLAAKFGRSQETIRYTLRNHDEQFPDAAVFPEVSGPLSEPQKQEILHRFRRGTTVAALAKRYGRTGAGA